MNSLTPATNAYDPPFTGGWQRWAAVGVKLFIVYWVLVSAFISGWKRYQLANAAPVTGPFRVGVYDVRRYVVNHDTIPPASGDTLRWKDVIIDANNAGSVNTSDQVFWQRYRRGYFRYKADTATHMATVWKTSTIPRDSTFLFTMRYEVPDTSTIRLHTVIRGDSIHVELARV